MIIIADTTPLNHLILIDQVSLLTALYGRVIVPQAEFSEFQDEAAPASVKKWVSNRPNWLEVGRITSLPDPGLAYPDAGQRGLPRRPMVAGPCCLPAHLRAHKISPTLLLRATM